jgi:hypothetical protein
MHNYSHERTNLEQRVGTPVIKNYVEQYSVGGVISGDAEQCYQALPPCVWWCTHYKVHAASIRQIDPGINECPRTRANQDVCKHR